MNSAVEESKGKSCPVWVGAHKRATEARRSSIQGLLGPHGEFEVSLNQPLLKFKKKGWGPETSAAVECLSTMCEAIGSPSIP